MVEYLRVAVGWIAFHLGSWARHWAPGFCWVSGWCLIKGNQCKARSDVSTCRFSSNKGGVNVKSCKYLYAIHWFLFCDFFVTCLLFCHDFPHWNHTPEVGASAIFHGQLVIALHQQLQIPSPQEPIKKMLDYIGFLHFISGPSYPKKLFPHIFTAKKKNFICKDSPYHRYVAWIFSWVLCAWDISMVLVTVMPYEVGFMWPAWMMLMASGRWDDPSEKWTFTWETKGVQDGILYKWCFFVLNIVKDDMIFTVWEYSFDIRYVYCILNVNYLEYLLGKAKTKIAGQLANQL